jgi:hypothetical protein
MRGLRLLPGDINLSFIPRRKIFFVFSIFLVISSIGLYLTMVLTTALILREVS